MKMFFAANNIYFVKDTNISLLKKKIFFALFLQQMNNHIGIHITIKKLIWSHFWLFTIKGPKR